MDVTCDRCGTDYEFEETLVSTRGTTVKCTQCGHLFKVYRPEAPIESDKEAHPWTVRGEDGSTHRLGSLADLTRLIGEGVFGRNDQVSRTGKAWKKLGDIDELKSFFPDSQRPAPRARKHTAPDLGLAPGASHSGNLPRGVSTIPPPPAAPAPADAGEGSRKRAPTPQPMRFETMGDSVDLESRSAREPRESREPRPSASHVPPPLTSEAAGPSAAPARRRTASATLTVPEPPPAAPPTPAPRSASTSLPAPAPEPSFTEARRSSALPWALSLLVLGSTAAAAVWLWPQFSQRMTPAPKIDPSAEFVARADAALATHRVQHFEDAVTEYVKALAHHEHDPHILSSVSRVYAVWAQELRFKVRALESEAAGKEDVERRSEIVAIEREARQLTEQAKRYAETAARKNPGNEAAEVALSDALRLSGNLVAARSEIDRATASTSAPSAEALRVASLLAIDEAQGDLRAGIKLASQAVAQEPSLIRARLLLARCLVAEGDLAGARYHMDTVSVRDRSHPGVVGIEHEIERKSEPGRSLDAGVDAGSAPEAPAAKNPAREDLSHDGYVARGQALIEQGQVAQAKRMFEQALFTRPSSAKAHTGLGFVALEKGRPALAVEHFAPAARAGHPEALIGLGDAYRRLKRPRDALKAYQSYVTRHPAGPQIPIARAQIERLNEELGSRPR